MAMDYPLLKKRSSREAAAKSSGAFWCACADFKRQPI
jgi:hypothetical protein